MIPNIAAGGYWRIANKFPNISIFQMYHFFPIITN